MNKQHKEQIINNVTNALGDVGSSMLNRVRPLIDLAYEAGYNQGKQEANTGYYQAIKGADELKNQVDHWKFKVAFGLYPVQMQELKHIADTNNIMPPKTTWVEPKMRSGLVIFPLDEGLYPRL
jgi:uncharacterized protein (DUF1015 family)